jgi:CRP/FNR family cyclic AMP-dependent transcriptional regulator
VPCEPHLLKDVPIFGLLDADELAVLAQQVELRSFDARVRVFKAGDPGGRAYIVISGLVRVSIVDEDHQEVIMDQPGVGEFFGFASLMDQMPHHTTATTIEPTQCIEIDLNDIQTLLTRKPMAGMDLLAALGRQFHLTERLVKSRAIRNPNDIIEEEETRGERVADGVARFGGSWTFISIFLAVLIIYSATNIILRERAWDPYPFILLNLFLSMLAAIQAPIIMMSQNRGDKKDRVRSELDYSVNRRAETEIQNLSKKLASVEDQLQDLKVTLSASGPT